MQIDWQRAINDILSKKLSCPRCGTLTDDVIIGYLRTPEASEWAPLCEGCNKRDNCDARKFVILCEPCAMSVRLRGRHVDEEGFMTEYAEWDETLGKTLAAQIGIDMTDDHWKAIRFLREDFVAQGETPTLRRVSTVGGIPTKQLFVLFPQKPAKKMAYVAGLPKPHGCV